MDQKCREANFPFHAAAHFPYVLIIILPTYTQKLKRALSESAEWFYVDMDNV